MPLQLACMHVHALHDVECPVAESKVCYLWVDLWTLFSLYYELFKQNFRDHSKSVVGQWHGGTVPKSPGQSGTSGGYDNQMC